MKVFEVLSMLEKCGLDKDLVVAIPIDNEATYYRPTVRVSPDGNRVVITVRDPRPGEQV